MKVTTYTIAVSEFSCPISFVPCPELSSLAPDMVFSLQVSRMIIRH